MKTKTNKKLNNKQYFIQLNSILDELFAEATRRGHTWHDLARITSLAVSTIYRLGNRETKYPQLRTILLICSGLSIQVTLVKGEKKMIRMAA